MILHFKDTKIGKLCNEEAFAKRKLGKKRALNLQKILTEFDYSTTLAEFHLTRASRRCHELSGNRKGQLAIDLDEKVRIVFEPTPPVPLKEDGGLDWSRIEEIDIIEIRDYHGKKK